MAAQIARSVRQRYNVPMNTIETVPTSAVVQRLQILVEFYRQGQASPLTKHALDKLLAYEMDVCQKQLSQLQRDMAQFEQRYALSSTEFYRRYQTGQTDDRMDYVEWASLVQMTRNLEERLRLLTGEN